MSIRVDGAAIVVWAGVYYGAIPLDNVLNAVISGAVAYVIARRLSS